MTPGVVAESDLAGTLKSEYVFFDGERVARRDGATGTGGVFYYFSDHLKTASVITDSAGVIKAESDYYPWGGELQFVNNDSNDYKFTGKKRDSETGLDYFGARYYSNALGRFMTPDWAARAIAVPYAEFSDPQSLNLYGYVRNLPTTKYDADGHCPDVCPTDGPKSLAELDKQNQVRKDLLIGNAKGLANVGISAHNMFLTMGESGSTPIPLFKPSNETQAIGMLSGTVIGTAASLNPVVLGESTTATLTRLAGDAVETVGPGQGAAYGTKVHSAFERGVKALDNPNLSTEASYLNGKPVDRGTLGSIRVDVAEGPRGAPTAVYDLKTGSATLTPARIQQIQQHVPKLPNGNPVPVTEIRPPQ